jgi:phosphonate transport system substrate-binding protein
MSIVLPLHRSAFVIGALIALTPLPSPAQAEDLIRIGIVPEAASTAASLEEKKPLQAYLSEALGMPVKLVIPKDYNATIEGLGNGSLDFASMGAVSYVKSHKLYGTIPLVQRDIDKQFHTVFITQASSPIKAIGDLKGKRFAFGDVVSTSGSVMPYRALIDAGLDPNKDLEWFRYTGSHAATVQAVAAGVADAGSAAEDIFKSLVADGKVDGSKVRVFYTTPPFVDYCWAARKDVPEPIQKKFVEAFMRLAPGQHDKVLAILRGQHYVAANEAEYQPILEMAQKLSLF